MDAELYRRVAELERIVKVLLDLNGEARAQLRPRDPMAICDAKGIQGPGLLIIKENYPAPPTIALSRFDAP
jgi:hypothetical protein